MSEKGYITRSLYVEVLRDLDKYLTEKGIPRPVILFIDGANPHISLEAAAFCKEKLIQPWLFKPNMTHIMQVFQTFLLLFFTIYFKPCDLTFFSSLKKQLKKLAWDWQCSPSNCGQSLNKYSIVALLHQATELCLDKPDLISNGFKRCGLYPWNVLAPDTSKLLPGTVFVTPTQPSPVTEPMLPQIETTLEDESLQPDISPTQTSSPNFLPCLPSYDVVFTPQPQPDLQLDTSSEMECTGQLNNTTEFDSISVQSPSQSELNMGMLLDESSLLDSTEFTDGSEIKTPQPSQPEANGAYWAGQTTNCPNCDRRILSKFYDMHTSTCKPVGTPPTSYPAAPTTPLPKPTQSKPAEATLVTVQEFTLDDRIIQLQKYEVLMLTPSQVLEFNSLFSAKKFDIGEPLYHCWLTHKLASIPTEAEALRRVLSNHTASQVPKRKAHRKQNLPVGEARYDPTSPEWVSILEEQENRKKVKLPKKVVKSQPAKLTKQKPKQNKPLKSVPPKNPDNKKADQSAKRKLRV